MISLLILAAAAAPCVRPRIHDGDNIRCGGVEMRLAGIDAAELPGSPKCRPPVPAKADCNPAHAFAARAALRQLVRGKRVTFRIVDASPFIAGFQASDRFGRPVVRAFAGGVDLSEAMLASGKAARWP